MKLHPFLRLLRRNLIWLVVLPALTAGTAWYFTRNEIKRYQSKATIYTGLASGYSILSEKVAFIDHQAISNAFDNLLTTLRSKETLRRVSQMLLTRHLRLSRPDSLVLGREGFAALQKSIPAPLRRELTEGLSEAETYARIDTLAHAPGSNPVKTLLFNSASPYALAQLDKMLKATRKNTSDMLDLDFEATDPALAQAALSLSIDVFRNRYADFRASETKPVVNYYKNRSRKAQAQLQSAENKLKSFGVDHRILDYEEQSKNVATSKEALADEYSRELMRNKAAKAAMDALAKRIADHSAILSTNTELLDKRADLADAENQLANARAYGRNTATISQLEDKVARLSDEMKTLARKYFTQGNAADSVPQTSLIDEWLTKVVDFEESDARLKVFSDRMAEYEEKTDEYTPLGSELRQLNRALSVAEKEYLNTIEGLDQATVRQKNAQMEGPLAVLDAPDFPLNPLPSRRSLLVAGALIVGLVLALLLLMVRFWLDRRVTSPEGAEARLGKPIVGAFPRTRTLSLASKAGRAALSGFEQVANAVNLEIARRPDDGDPVLVLLVSTRAGQGKSWTGRGLGQVYAAAGRRVAYLFPETKTSPRGSAVAGLDEWAYLVQPDLMTATDPADLPMVRPGFDARNYELILIELPALLSHPIPVGLVRQSRVSLLVTQARATWQRADQHVIALYEKIASGPVLALLNGVATDLVDAPRRAEFEQTSPRPLGRQARLTKWENAPKADVSLVAKTARS